MNKQIEKLLGQALDSAVPETWTTLTPEQFTKVSEKFTELIVRECMNVARQQRNPANLNYKPSERFVEDLRQHFGVEE